RMLLIDLGGGSCELTRSDGGHIKEIVTLPLGAVRLTQEFIRHDPPAKEELKRLNEFIAEETARIPRQISRAAAGLAVATSGTAERSSTVYEAGARRLGSGDEETGQAPGQDDIASKGGSQRHQRKESRDRDCRSRGLFTPDGRLRSEIVPLLATGAS